MQKALVLPYCVMGKWRDKDACSTELTEPGDPVAERYRRNKGSRKRLVLGSWLCHLCY